MSSGDQAGDDSLVTGGDYSGELLKEVLTNWRDAESQFKRTIALIVILAAIFELLTRGSGTGITFSFIHITDLRLVEIYIPLVVAYETYSLQSIFSELDYYDVRAEDMLQALGGGSDAIILVTPPNSILSSTLNLSIKRSEEDAVGTALFVLGVLKWAGVMCGPLVFEVYAFVRLADKYGVASWAYWLSAILSLSLGVMAVLTTIASLRGRGRFASAVRSAIKAGSSAFHGEKEDSIT